jgi:hypothetical protein
MRNKSNPKGVNLMDNFNNTQPVLVTVMENHGEIHYIYSSAISPVGMDFAGIGLIATIAFVATKNWFSRKYNNVDTTQEIETETEPETENTSRPRTFFCKRFYSRLEQQDPFVGQYDHWVIREPEPRKSAKDMTREEILAEAGIKL